MYYSGKTSSHPYVLIAAVLGLAAWAMPLIVPWHACLALSLVILGTFYFEHPSDCIAWLACAVVLLGLLFGGILPSPLVTAVLAAVLLARAGALCFCCTVLLLGISNVFLLQDYISGQLAAIGLEASAPSIVAIIALGFVFGRKPWFAAIAMLISLMTTFVCKQFHLSPELFLALPYVPVVAFARALLHQNDSSAFVGLRVRTFLLVGLCLISWVGTMPRTTKGLYVLLPPSQAEYEAKFFDNYVAALNFVGILATHASQPEEIPDSSTVLLPWVTTPLTDALGINVEDRFRKLAEERGWTVLMGGEHTNLGDIANRVEEISGLRLLRNDLTVPYRNSDKSGALHIGSVVDWPFDAMLNRGGSISPPALRGRVLLAADGWWAEPDIGEWLWTGDYLYEPSDRAGRIVLAASADQRRARWVIVGDNTPLLNSQFIADPRALRSLLNLSTLWPLFLRDSLIITLLTFYILVPERQRATHKIIMSAVLIAAAAALSLALFPANGKSRWESFYKRQSAFDPANFNETFAKNRGFLQGPQFIRNRFRLEGNQELSNGISVVFGHVEGDAIFSSAHIGECHRLGGLDTDEGPRLMDAQVCHVEGDAEVVLGSRSAAAAFWVSSGTRHSLVILDPSFLGSRAPNSNSTWLEEQLAARLRHLGQ